MQKIKALFDPNRLLNPGVIINEDKHSHISNLKPMPAADNLVDRCIECGFCEPVCPSRTLTLSPRQRIVLYRELQRRRAAGENVASSELEQVFEYQGLDTCAATGLCAERCPSASIPAIWSKNCASPNTKNSPRLRVGQQSTLARPPHSLAAA